jgi:hypothetical protein
VLAKALRSTQGLAALRAQHSPWRVFGCVPLLLLALPAIRPATCPAVCSQEGGQLFEGHQALRAKVYLYLGTINGHRVSGGLSLFLLHCLVVVAPDLPDKPAAHVPSLSLLADR